MSWSRRFDEPIELPNGNKLLGGLLMLAGSAHSWAMGTKSRDRIYVASIRGLCGARQGSAQGSRQARLRGLEPTHVRLQGTRSTFSLGDALNAGYRYLEDRCLGCDAHQAVALDIVRRLKATHIHELERHMRCRDCSRLRGYPHKRSHVVALRPTKISATDPPSTGWPGER